MQGCTLKSDTPSGSCSAWNDILSFKAILLQSGGHRKERICTQVCIHPQCCRPLPGRRLGTVSWLLRSTAPDMLIVPPVCIHTPDLQPKTVPLLLPLPPLLHT